MTTASATESTTVPTGSTKATATTTLSAGDVPGLNFNAPSISSIPRPGDSGYETWRDGIFKDAEKLIDEAREGCLHLDDEQHQQQQQQHGHGYGLGSLSRRSSSLNVCLENVCGRWIRKQTQK